MSDLGTDARSVSGYSPRAVLDDGRAFFNSRPHLVFRDVNGRSDVHTWNGQDAELVSSGTGNADATFADASTDGRDVFFFTAERLVAQDSDDEIDVYDARLGGGLPDQNRRWVPTPVRDGDGCQGAAVALR